MQFSGKSVIITGAGKGIGRACARTMAERGAEVIALSRTASDLDSLRAEIGGRSVVVDLADPAATRRAMAQAGTADFLINSAGINVLDRFSRMWVSSDAMVTFEMMERLRTRPDMSAQREIHNCGSASSTVTR